MEYNLFSIDGFIFELLFDQSFLLFLLEEVDHLYNKIAIIVRRKASTKLEGLLDAVYMYMLFVFLANKN